MILLATAIVILIAILLFLIRALLGPTTYDRILAVNALGTKTVILVGLASFLTNRPDYLDIALLYALINFIATIAILKYIERRRLG